AKTESSSRTTEKMLFVFSSSALGNHQTNDLFVCLLLASIPYNHALVSGNTVYFGNDSVGMVSQNCDDFAG
ncbi:hypothetical protein, partial [Candidatus Entotheonella palauensis]|uniref:hypothetical protein n=1 Tax=Candidatus Entotheonella palauensis TaxID=93172 RepID=UPI001C4E0B5B